MGYFFTSCESCFYCHLGEKMYRKNENREQNFISGEIADIY